VWSSTANAAGRSRGVSRRSAARPPLIRRIRWWFRTGALLAILGVLGLARTARARWEPVLLLVGALIAAAGFAIPAVGWAFFLGLLALIVTLLTGISGQQRRRGPVHRMGPTL
jgi:energy-converting hydrogenase Eha subunit E